MTNTQPPSDVRELLPCPFCGGVAALAKKCVYCRECGCQGFYGYEIACGDNEPIERWNTRTTAKPTSDAWLPIETAPRDGTHILVCRWPVTGRWSCNKVWWGKGDFDSKRWIMSSRSKLRYLPTHWQPLPLPPVDTAAQAGQNGEGEKS